MVKPRVTSKPVGDLVVFECKSTSARPASSAPNARTVRLYASGRLVVTGTAPCKKQLDAAAMARVMALIAQTNVMDAKYSPAFVRDPFEATYTLRVEGKVRTIKHPDLFDSLNAIENAILS